MVMSDKAAFASFASSGAFSGDPALSIPKQVAQISAGLQLFVLTSALGGNGYRAVFTNWDCEGTEGAYCGFDGQTDWSYESTRMLGGVHGFLSKLEKIPKGNAKLMNTITQNGWATQESLFEGGVKCAASGHTGESIIGLNFDNPINVDCLNRLGGLACYQYPQNAEFGERDARWMEACSSKGGACPIAECPPFVVGSLPTTEA